MTLPNGEDAVMHQQVDIHIYIQEYLLYRFVSGGQEAAMIAGGWISPKFFPSLFFFYMATCKA